MNEELDDLTWLKLNFQNRIVERTLRTMWKTKEEMSKAELLYYRLGYYL